MARIRTVKPEFFRHEGLQDLEAAHPGKYPMLVFEGIWTICDREGRFLWKPRSIKLDILPFLEFNMSETMDLLAQSGFIQKYEIEDNVYGEVLAWDRHQIVSRDEPPSEIPSNTGKFTPYFRPLTQTQRLAVYERDDWRCLYCGREMRNDRRAACLDHVIPYSKGGTNRAKNLATSCKKCNAAKGDKTPNECNLPWPIGLGEHINDTVNGSINTPSTGGLEVPDKEREKEGKGKGREKEQEGSVRETNGRIDLPVDNSAADEWLIDDNDEKPAEPPERTAACFEKSEIPKQKSETPGPKPPEPPHGNTHGERWTEKLSGELNQLGDEIRDRYGINYHRRVQVWVETNYGRKNPTAMCHCLRRLIQDRQKGETIPVPERWLDALLNGNKDHPGENGKFEAAESAAVCEEHKTGPTQIGAILAGMR